MNEAVGLAFLEKQDGTRIPVSGTCSIGRAPTNEVVLPFNRVSRRHALIHFQGENEFWLVDLGSSNGTYVDGKRVNQPVQLRDNASLEIGETRLLFRQPTGGSSAALDLDGLDKTVRNIKTLDCWLLVADIQGSTELSQRLGAEKLPIVTGGWFSTCKQIIEDNGGTINKFLGDGFFAYWIDAPGSDRPIAVALMDLKGLQSSPDLQFRVVLHLGKVLMGGVASMGEESLAGDDVNLVFRMEKLAASLDRPRLTSAAVKDRLITHLEMVEEGQHFLAGFRDKRQFFSF